MASFGSILGGVLDILDPTPGNLISGGLQSLAGTTFGGREATPLDRSRQSVLLPALTGEISRAGFGGGGMASFNEVLPVTTGERSPLGYDPWSFQDVLIPDVIERAIAPEPAANGCGIGSVVAPTVQRVRHTAPNPNYVVVECPRGSGRKVAMLREVARKFGYWRPRKKPPIKASDWSALMKADRTIKKLDRVVKAANNVQGKRRYTRGRAAGRC